MLEGDVNMEESREEGEADTGSDESRPNTPDIHPRSSTPTTAASSLPDTLAGNISPLHAGPSNAGATPPSEEDLKPLSLFRVPTPLPKRKKPKAAQLKKKKKGGTPLNPRPPRRPPTPRPT